MALENFSKPFVYRRNPDKSVRLWASKLVPAFDHALGYKPKTVYLYAPTEKALKAKIREWKPEKATLDKDTTLVEYVLDEFFPALEADVRADGKSYDAYKARVGRLSNYLLKPNYAKKPFLRNTAVFALSGGRLGSITPEAVSRYFDYLKSQEVSQEVRKQLKIDLGLAFKRVRAKMAYRPDDLLDGVSFAKQAEREVLIYDVADVTRAIHDPAVPLQWRAIVAVQLTLMCRPSEIWALTWADFSEDFASVNFTKAVRRSATGFAPSAGTKNKRNRLGIPVPAFLAGLLRELRKTRLAEGTASENVFVTEDGQPMTKDRFHARWPRIRKAMRLPETGLRFYDLKHTGNSFLAAQGVSTAVRRQITGHADDRMVNRVYLKVGKAETVAAVASYDSLVPAANPAGAA